MTWRAVVVKAVVALIALGALGVLFVRSVRNVEAEPYTVPRDRLAKWTLALEPPSSSSGAVLVLRPQSLLAPGLFSQIFARAGESLAGPTPPGMPLLLRAEVERAGAADVVPPDAIFELARGSGLEQAEVTPRCLARRRLSDVGRTEQVFFLLFDLPAFDEFRRQVAARLGATGSSAGTFEPASLSPVLIIAATSSEFSRWMPIKADPAADCLAPVALQ